MTPEERREVLTDLARLGQALDDLHAAEPVSAEAAERQRETVARVESEKRRLELLLLDVPSNVRALPSRGGAFTGSAEIMERDG